MEFLVLTTFMVCNSNKVWSVECSNFDQGESSEMVTMGMKICRQSVQISSDHTTWDLISNSSIPKTDPPPSSKTRC